MVWSAWRECLKLRERAADDLVLRAGAAAPEYAEHLLAIARSRQASSLVECATVAMARRSQLEGRLLAILDPTRDRSSIRRASLITASLLALGAVAPLAATQPRTGPVPFQAADQELLAKGDMAREQGRFDQARVLYEQVLHAHNSGPEAAATLIRLGTVELATKRFEQAISDFEQAPLDDSQKTAEARMWMAVAQERQNNLDAADALYQSALAAEDPNSPASATTLELYAQLLQKQGRREEASATREQASQLRKTQSAQAISEALPSGPDVYKVGNGVSAPVLVSKVEPQYTPEARTARYTGTVFLSLEIGADGSPRRIQVVRGLGFGLDEKAVEAVTHWKFKPGIKNGQSVAVLATVEINFNLL